MTTIYKATGAEDFLALVPRLLSYSPVRSLVLVPFAGKQTLGAMRIDLPLVEDPAEIDRLASTFIGMVCKVASVDGVAPIVYTSEAFAASDGPPHQRLISALLSRADLCGLRVVDALCVAADGWGSYLDPSCPPAGRPLVDLRIEDERLDAFPVAAGDQNSGAELPAVDLAEKVRVGRALAALDEARRWLMSAEEPVPVESPDGHGFDSDALLAACGLDDVPALYEDAIDWDAGNLDPFDAASLAWCLARPLLRDVALVQWCGDLADGDAALEAQLRWSKEREEIPERIGQRMFGEGPRPDPDRLMAALTLVRRVAAATPRAERPGALSVCAWLAWALGRSTHAASYAQAALEIDPRHRMAAIVLTLADSGHLPEWAFAQPRRDASRAIP